MFASMFGCKGEGPNMLSNMLLDLGFLGSLFSLRFEESSSTRGRGVGICYDTPPVMSWFILQ